jgi:hypothetical protein
MARRTVTWASSDLIDQAWADDVIRMASTTDDIVVLTQPTEVPC